MRPGTVPAGGSCVIDGPARGSAGPFLLRATMTDSRIDAFDDKEGYCRLLGHHLRFSYCRTCREGLPCFKILDCWFENFDIRKFVEENYSAEEIRDFLEPPKPKMQSLMTLIQRAQERMKKDP